MVLSKILRFSASIGSVRRIFFIRIAVVDHHVAVKYVASENVLPLISPTFL
jgi:hypothetical protein